MARLTLDGSAKVAALSPDGRYVVHVRRIAGRDSLWVRQTGTQSQLQIVPPADVRYVGAAFSADGNDVYYVTYPLRGEWGTLFRVSALGGEPYAVLTASSSRPSEAAQRDCTWPILIDRSCERLPPGVI